MLLRRGSPVRARRIGLPLASLITFPFASSWGLMLALHASGSTPIFTGLWHHTKTRWEGLLPVTSATALDTASFHWSMICCPTGNSSSGNGWVVVSGSDAVV